MGLKDYVVAIPSYKRPDTLKNKTLKVLQRYKIMWIVRYCTAQFCS